MSPEQQGGPKTAGQHNIAPATGKLGVMVVGLGAVATTMIAGVGRKNEDHLTLM